MSLAGLHLTELLEYLSVVGDQTSTQNRVVYLHYTEGLIVTADVVMTSFLNELNVHGHINTLRNEL